MSVRVRFAPSPTGALHIGGVRTALYNYLFARKHGGEFVLRIEDTDQARYVPGAEAYIVEALRWLGLNPDEGPNMGGEYGPYRQSERKEIYRRHALALVERGRAYYAFDTPDELEHKRAEIPNFMYGYASRMAMRNSLSLPQAEWQRLLDAGTPHVVRLKVEPGEEVRVSDLVRGEVCFQSSELDDKVLFKADGMPTYHLANVVDDRLMRITHVIRGEEWLSSTAHHILLYRGFGWESEMPAFAHLPLILKPEGDGKLSKRDGAKFGMPVFPIAWQAENPEDSFPGFRETGFLPEATINFLALLGWHPSDDRELMSCDELIAAFSIEQISKGGARFDYEKAKWFNAKYIQAMPDAALAPLLAPYAFQKGYRADTAFLEKAASLMKDRATFLPDIVEQGYYLFEAPREYDQDTLQKKWNSDSALNLAKVCDFLGGCAFENGPDLEQAFKAFLQENQIKPGDVLPLLRIALAGVMKGPAVFDMAVAIGKEETLARLDKLAKMPA